MVMGLAPKTASSDPLTVMAIIGLVTVATASSVDLLVKEDRSFRADVSKETLSRTESPEDQSSTLSNTNETPPPNGMIIVNRKPS
jgi:hypothetical protein